MLRGWQVFGSRGLCNIDSPLSPTLHPPTRPSLTVKNSQHDIYAAFNPEAEGLRSSCSFPLFTQDPRLQSSWSARSCKYDCNSVGKIPAVCGSWRIVEFFTITEKSCVSNPATQIKAIYVAFHVSTYLQYPTPTEIVGFHLIYSAIFFT